MTEMPFELNVLRNATEEHLHRRGIFDIDDYGWLSENEVDPEFTGYAMWATAPPYEHDFDKWQKDVPPGRAPTKAEQRLMELGHDFFGLMKTARHFLGYALLYQSAVEPLRVEPTEFDFNEFASLVSLSAAADRLRDFIIVATLGRKTKAEDQLDKAYGALRASGLVKEADALRSKVPAVKKVRDARHESAHGLATQPAHIQRRLIGADRQAFEEKRWRNANRQEVSFEALKGQQERADADELAAVEARAQLLCDSYIALIKTGELSFRVELDLRQRKKRQGTHR
jgi:hypothetical protein